MKSLILAFIFFISKILSKNIFKLEKDLTELITKESLDIYSIEDKIEKYYNKSIEVYISVIDSEFMNTLLIYNSTNEIELKQEYLNYYDNLIGGEDLYLNKDNQLVINKTEEFLNDHRIKVFYIMNVFFNNFFANCSFNEETSWLKFYDFNLIINSNNNLRCKEQFDILEVNNLDKIKKIEKEEVFIINENLNIIRKVERKIKLNKLLESNILNRFDSKINLKNHLLKSELDEVDLVLTNIIKLLTILEKLSTNDKTYLLLLDKLEKEIK